MLTTTMDHPPHEQRSTPPFQARALHFLKKFALRARGSDRKLRDGVSPVTIPPQEFQRAHSSLDLLRKPDVPPLIGFRVEDSSNPMDTDDSSQDASPSGNSLRLRHSRRHSAWGSLHTTPIHPTFAGRGAAPLFCRHQASLTNDCLVDDAANVLAPAPVFLRSNVSVDAVVVLPRSQALVSGPEILPQIDIPPALQADEPAAQDMLHDDTPRPLGDASSHDVPFTTPSTDPLPSTSSDTGTLSTAPSIYAGEVSTSEATQIRPSLLPHHSAPLPPPFRVTTERGLRLSPSIITRQPMPLLNLPSLPPPPPVPDSPPKKSIPLRHMPSLSRHGQSTLACQANQENEAPEDSDEDEGEGDEGDEEEHADALSIHQSDDEDDEPPSAGPSGTQGIKSAQKQRAREDDESPSVGPGHTSPDSPQSESALVDLFCSKTYIKSIHFAPSTTSLEMYPFSPSIPNSDDVNQRRVLDPDLPIPGARLEAKPSLYRVASRSMIDLGSTRRVDRHLHPPRAKEDAERSNAASIAETHSDTEESDTEAVIGRLLRRTSMPSFHPTSDPPPYPTFDPYPKENHATLRGDEGRDWLPPYSNSLYLIAIMPRKMEFSSPGIQARDRKWRRVVCELEGTTFRVYKCPPGASGAGVLGDWWEKRVGVGDVATPNPPRTRKKEEVSEIPEKAGADEPTLAITPPSSTRSISVPPGTRDRRRRESLSSMATQSTTMTTPRAAKRTSGASFLSPFRGSSNARPEGSAGDGLPRSNSRDLELLPVDLHGSRTSLSHESSGRATPAAAASHPPRLASRLSFLPVATGRVQRSIEVSKPPKSDLLHAYTLQHAESGLGNDYLKRKNVIRVRLEGEQFLLQAPDVPAVVEWIEGLHAGSNIALDIDQRPMPRGPMFPRRRRRRTRRAESGETGQQA